MEDFNAASALVGGQFGRSVPTDRSAWEFTRGGPTGVSQSR